MIYLRLGSSLTWAYTYDTVTTGWIAQWQDLLQLTCNNIEDIKATRIDVRASDLQSNKQGVCEFIEKVHDYGETGVISKCYDFSLIKFYVDPSRHRWICEVGRNSTSPVDYIKMQYFQFPIFERAIQNGGLPLHSALIEKDGYGFILAGNSNTGKSTCYNRIPVPWKALCDDLTLVVFEKDRLYNVHPFPTWSNYIFGRTGITWNVEMHFPLKSLFFLEKSDTDETIKLLPGETVFIITNLASQMCNLYWRYMKKEEIIAWKKKIFENAWEIASKFPCYILRHSLQGEFWKEIEKVI